MTTYEFNYVHLQKECDWNESKELNVFADAVDYAALQGYALYEKTTQLYSYAGDLLRVEIIHLPTGYEVCTLDLDQIIAYRKAVQLVTYPQLTNKKGLTDGNKCSNFLLQIFFGGKNYQLQAIELLSVMADMYLMEFNIPDADFVCPPTYLNTADAKRDLQYLAEFCKIAQFQLQGTDIKSW